MIGFEVELIETMTLACRNRLTDMYKLSPLVWQAQEGSYEVMLRAVPHRDDDPRLKIAEIWHGRSVDGLHFEMDIAPSLFPGPDETDLDGCEDPTVVLHSGRTHVWYTGWNQAQLTGRLLYAVGPDVHHLEKRGVALESAAPYEKPKEAAVVPCAGGRWRMFFEFARDQASRIGVATAEDLGGPWTIAGEALERRIGHFDDWHLSTGPIVRAGSANPVMFYNGANKEAQWRVGWVAFDSGYRRIVARSAEPLIGPHDVQEGYSNVAFASSAIEQGERIWLYYSVSDMALHRATLVATGSPG